ncbi:MAG: heme NO-binding domain-containing protein [Nitrospira sp.]|nr:heme NO-binding protein [Candidatus Manganitrophaceae bacterium]
MYGMVNKAIREMVIQKHGEDTWRKTYEKVGSPADFDSFARYKDSITYELVGAIADVLEEPADKVLHKLGIFWVMDVALVHYRDLMESSGTDFVDFLRGLDHMHSRIKVTFPAFSPPSFRCIVLREGVCELDYYSDRKGLLPFVKGLLEGLAIHFKQEIQVRDIPDEDHPMPCKRMEISYSSTKRVV